jgi:hypothetical protein
MNPFPVLNNANVFHVSPDGSDSNTGFASDGVVDLANDALLTISEAISEASANDLIIIHPGEYEEEITVSKKLTLCGMPGAKLISGSTHGITISADCNIYGLSIQANDSGPLATCIVCSAADLIINIENCKFKTLTGTATGAKGIAFSSNAQKSVNIRNNFFDCAGKAIEINSIPETVNIENNIITITVSDDNLINGITISTLSGSIKNNRVYINSSGDGGIIGLNGTETVIMENNTVFISTTGDGNVTGIQNGGIIKNNLLQVSTYGDGNAYPLKTVYDNICVNNMLMSAFSTVILDPDSTGTPALGTQVGDLSNAFLKDNGITHNKFFNKEV